MSGRSPKPSLPFPNSFWIEPGRLLAGEHPSVTSGTRTLQRLQAIVAAGVDCFLDLTQPGEMPPYQSLLSDLGQAGRKITYACRPLQDHTTPSSPDVITDILDYLEHALGNRERVYVHCRAGIGRTNLVLGCWMCQQGLSGAAAINRLNVLWKANARSASWARVPEPHQEAYVLAFAARSKQHKRAVVKPPVVRIGIKERYSGALFGLACGDSIGFAGKKGTPTKGTWTDDTALSLLLAESLLACNGFEARDQIERFLAWQEDGLTSSAGLATGITASVAKALSSARWTGNAFAGSHDPDRWEPESLSRVGCVALFALNAPDKAMQWAADASRVTHQSPGILDACRFYAALILAVLGGVPKAELLARARSLLADLHPKPLRAPIARLAALSVYPKEPESDGPHAVAMLLQRTLWALGVTEDFKDGLQRLLDLGGDTDVQGAIFGQLAGALYGVESIPRAWRRALVDRDRILSLSDQLLSAATLKRV